MENLQEKQNKVLWIWLLFSAWIIFLGAYYAQLCFYYYNTLVVVERPALYAVTKVDIEEFMQNKIDTMMSSFIQNPNPIPFFSLSDQDRQIVCYIVAGEAGNEPMEGKMLVAQCLLHAMVKDQISVSEVRKKYLYSGWCEDLESTAPKAWAEVCEAVSRVFDDGEFVSDKPILFFYAPKYAKGKWHRTLPHDQVYGGHSFHYLEEDESADWFLELRK